MIATATGPRLPGIVGVSRSLLIIPSIPRIYWLKSYLQATGEVTASGGSYTAFELVPRGSVYSSYI